MRRLEVRRHSLTKKGADRGSGSHLSADGVRLARAIGESLGAIDRVSTSASPRALETALAMGFAVDEIVDLPSGYVPGEIAHHDQWTWSRPYDTYAERLAGSDELAAVAAAHVAHWRSLVTRVPEGGAALRVSPGGTIEPALVAAVPGADRSDWGPALSHGDGATLDFDGERFVRVRIRRAVG